MISQLTQPRLGVILLDIGYADEEMVGLPTQQNGLSVQPVGSLDHPATWGCATLFRVARGCAPDDTARATRHATVGLRAAARALDGRVDLITTDCAYTTYAHEAFDGVMTPVVSGSLLLLDFARALGEVMILASDSRTLMSLAGPMPAGTRVVGLEEQPEWLKYQHYTFDAPPLDRDAMARQVISVLSSDLAAHGAPAAMILECTGLPQFRGAVREVFTGPLIDIVSVVHDLLDVPRPACSMFGSKTS